MKPAKARPARALQRPDLGPTLKRSTQTEVWSLHPESAAAASRFQRFVEDLPAALPRVSPALGLLLCSIAYDCVLNEDDLIGLAQASSTFEHPARACRVSWTSRLDGQAHLEARCLSVRSRLIVHRLPPQVDWPAMLLQLNEFMKSNYPDADTSGRVPVLNQVLSDAAAWWYLHLPLCLFSHVQGVVRMAILDETVLQRMGNAHLQTIIAASPVDEALGEAHDQAQDELLDRSSNRLSGYPRQTIGQLHSIFSVGKNSAGLRLATHLQTRDLRAKLILAIELARAEGWVASVLLSWAEHLLSSGSLRKANPAVSTLSAYLHVLLEPLANALLQLRDPPVLYSQDEWHQLFERLQEHNATGQHAAALASLHQWAVRTYGCDPMPDVVFQSVETSQVHANLVWPDEQQNALDSAATVSPDERVYQQVQVMLALGAGGLFRIADLAGLTLNDLQVHEGTLWVNVNPGRGLHGGKTRAARRFVRIHDPTLISLITQFCARRQLESKFSSTKTDLLFGDPHTPQKLYRMGHCIRLTNELLKMSTGDDRVSFHSLRHSGASSRAYTLLTQVQPTSAVSQLDELTHEMGHASRKTLWSTYFHFPEFVMREAIDRIPSVAQFSCQEAAFWLEQSSASLRQRACRASAESAPSSALYSRWVRLLADSSSTPLRLPSWCLKIQQASVAQPKALAPKNFHWVRQALAIISRGSNTASACLQLSCTPQELCMLCHAIQSTIRSIAISRGRASAPLLLTSANSDHALDWANQQLKILGCTFALGSSLLIQELARFLEHNADSRACTEAGLAWTRMRRGNVLSLDDPAATQALLHLLRLSKYPAEAMLIRIQSETQIDLESLQRIESEIREIRSEIRLAFGSSIRIESVKPRRGRPGRYMLVSRSRLAPGITAPPAALRMDEFHGLLFQLCVYQSMSRERTLA